MNDRAELPGFRLLAGQAQRGPSLEWERVETVHVLGLTAKSRVGTQYTEASRQKATGPFWSAVVYLIMPWKKRVGNRKPGQKQSRNFSGP